MANVTFDVYAVAYECEWSIYRLCMLFCSSDYQIVNPNTEQCNAMMMMTMQWIELISFHENTDNPCG